MENSTFTKIVQGPVFPASEELFLVTHPNIKPQIVSHAVQPNGIFKSFIQYTIQLKPFDVVIRRRYTDVKLLHGYLAKNYPDFVLPPIPKKQTGEQSPKVIKYRLYAIENFLQLVASGYWYDPVVNQFFQALSSENLKFIEGLQGTRKIDCENLETLDGKIGVNISPELDAYYTAQKENITKNLKLNKKLRELTKKLIKDQDTVKKDLEDVSACYDELSENQKKLAAYTSNQKVNPYLISESKQFLHAWAQKIAMINHNIEQTLWHNSKYQSQIYDNCLAAIKFRDQQLEFFNAELKAKPELTEKLQNNYGYVNNQISQQVQLAIQYCFMRLREDLQQLKHDLVKVHVQLTDDRDRQLDYQNQ